MHILLRAHGTFFKIDHMLDHKTSLNKFKRIEIILSMFSEQEKWTEWKQKHIRIYGTHPTVSRWKFITINGHMRSEEHFQISNLIICFKKLEKEE